MDNPWNNPRILAAAKQIALAHVAGAQDTTATMDLNDNERALAHYLARAGARISQLIQEELERAKLLDGR